MPPFCVGADERRGAVTEQAIEHERAHGRPQHVHQLIAFKPLGDVIEEDLDFARGQSLP